MNNLNFCFKRTNLDMVMNRLWCPDCCDCSQWCSNGSNQTLTMSNGYEDCSKGSLDTRRICCGKSNNCPKSGCKMDQYSGECVPSDN